MTKPASYVPVEDAINQEDMPVGSAVLEEIWGRKEAEEIDSKPNWDGNFLGVTEVKLTSG